MLRHTPRARLLSHAKCTLLKVAVVGSGSDELWPCRILHGLAYNI